MFLLFERQQYEYDNSGHYFFKDKKVIFQYNSDTIFEYHYPDPDGSMKSIDGKQMLIDSDPDKCSSY